MRSWALIILYDVITALKSFIVPDLKPSFGNMLFRYSLSFPVKLSFFEHLLCATHFTCLISKLHNNLIKLAIIISILQMKRKELTYPGSHSKLQLTLSPPRSLALNHVTSQSQQLGMSFSVPLLLNVRDSAISQSIWLVHRSTNCVEWSFILWTNSGVTANTHLLCCRIVFTSNEYMLRVRTRNLLKVELWDISLARFWPLG